MYYIAQGIGMIALLIAILSFQQNTQKRIVTFQMVSSVFFCVHFCMLGAVLGGVLNGIGIFRAAIFRQRDKAWASNKLWFVLFCILCIAAGLFFWEGPISLFPILSMILTTVAFWIKNARAVRFVTMPSSPLWMVYNWINHSYPGFFTEVCVLSSILVAIFRYDILPALRKKSV
ncbi:MAG: YgjV family protein [Ruminococcaceae bacterium]|nr:YgjV family protein [Oscillospiraceae bacterium]